MIYDNIILEIRRRKVKGYIEYEYNYKLRKAEVILMQFTGLKDKNGKEIYEGDIYESKNVNKTKTNYAVFWDKEECRYKIIFYSKPIYDKGKKWVIVDLLPSNWVKVIGNIYENPELLKYDLQ